MLMRLCRTIVSVALLVLMPSACGVARAQFGGFGFPTAGYGFVWGIRGYGGYGGAVGSSYGYGIRTGQVGSGYQSAGGTLPADQLPAGQLPQAGYSTRPQTTYSPGPLYVRSPRSRVGMARRFTRRVLPAGSDDQNSPPRTPPSQP